MRYPLVTTVVTLAVTLAGPIAWPAFAGQAKSAASEPLMLARNNGGGPNMFALLQDIQRLQDQVRSLRGQVDTLQYQLRQNEQGQRDLYKNLDQRISALEKAGNGGGRQSSAGAGGGGTGRAAHNGNANTQTQSRYNGAFNELKNGNYDAAIRQFNSFLDQYPDSGLSDNAWYWLGEANYVQRNYDASLKSFRTVVNRFSASDKVPAALYKIGVIQDEQGQTDNAKATLKRVIDQYPSSDGADLARKRLRSING